MTILTVIISTTQTTFNQGTLSQLTTSSLPFVDVCGTVKENPHHRFVGGSIFYDHASHAIFIYHQVSLGSSNTIRSKDAFESEARLCGHTICRYQTNNGHFTSRAFEETLISSSQCQIEHTVSGVGAHHQNGSTKRAIQTVSTMGRCMLLHLHLRWPDQFQPSLWSMASDYATWIHNHVPQSPNGRAPMEIFCGATLDCTELRRVWVFGCPCYMLDPKLQDGHKLPKWAARSRQGQFLGFSKQHSTTIGMIRNLTSGHISPQFHVVYDKHFSKVTSSWEPPDDDSTTWPEIFSINHYLPNHDPSLDGTLPPVPPSWQRPTPPTCGPSPMPSASARPEGETTPPILTTPPKTPRNNDSPLDIPSFSPNDSSSPTRFPSPVTTRTPFRTKQGEVASEKQGEATPEKQGEVVQGKQGEVATENQGEATSQSGKQGEPQNLEPTVRRSQRSRNAPCQFPDPERHVTMDLPPEHSSWGNSTSSSRYFLGQDSFIPYVTTDTANINRSPTAMAKFANCLDWDIASNPSQDNMALLFDRTFNQQATSHLNIINDWDPRFFAAKSEDSDTSSVFNLQQLSHNDRQKWRTAMDCELKKLEARDTFRMVPRHTAQGKEIVD